MLEVLDYLQQYFVATGVHNIAKSKDRQKPQTS
jgi:hypothetical protein